MREHIERLPAGGDIGMYVQKGGRLWPSFSDMLVYPDTTVGEDEVEVRAAPQGKEEA
jgi:hypothetical protein